MRRFGKASPRGKDLEKGNQAKQDPRIPPKREVPLREKMLKIPSFYLQRKNLESGEIWNLPQFF